MRAARATHTADAMSAADMEAPAELFVARRGGSKRGGLAYHRFATAAEAIEFAVDEFPGLRADDVVMAVDDKRFDLGAMRAMRRDAPAD